MWQFYNSGGPNLGVSFSFFSMGEAHLNFLTLYSFHAIKYLSFDTNMLRVWTSPLSRFVKFHHCLVSSNKFAIRFLAKIKECDNRSVMGKTLTYLMSECELQQNQLSQLTPQLVKLKCRYFPLPKGEEWRVPVIMECMEAINGRVTVSNFQPHEFLNLMNSLCID